MKKLALFLALTAMVVGVAIADETVPYPFWQHGYGCTTFYSVSNANPSGGNDITVTINLLDVSGGSIAATTSTVAAQTAWMPDTAYWDPDNWYYTQSGVDLLGFGNYIVQATEDVAYLWSCIYGLLPQGQAGYTVVLPGNPYGL